MGISDKYADKAHDNVPNKMASESEAKTKTDETAVPTPVDAEGDGLEPGQTTADNLGDILGI